MGMVEESTMGTPPTTVAASTYCLANPNVLSLAPNMRRIGSMNTKQMREKHKVTIAAITML